jgi:rod shape-determining protein MreC
MYNLISFIWKHHFTFLFLLLQALAITILINGNKFHHTSFLTFSNEVSGNIYEFQNNINSYFSLKKQNDELAKENSKLKSLTLVDAFTERNDDYVLVNDTVYLQQYKYLGATAVNSSVNKRNNYLVLNKGYAQGVKSEMGVISATGVVGVVRDVSKNFCTAISVLHKETKISAKLKKNNYFGILTWEAEDNPFHATLSDIPKHVHIAKGDTIITRGSSGIFPAGVLVGFVDSFEEIPGSVFLKIKIRLSTDFKNVSAVYIVNNLLKEEQRELEQKVEND